MNNDIKRCPFCGFNALYVQDVPDHPETLLVRCLNANCPLHKEYIFTLEQWQSRPIEDALRKQLDKMTTTLIEIGDKFDGLPPGDIANRALSECALESSENE